MPAPFENNLGWFLRLSRSSASLLYWKATGAGSGFRRNLFVLLIIALPLFLFALTSYAAITAIDEDAPWPRTRSTNGHTVTLHLPQVERWTSNSFQARAVVEVKPAKAKKELLGVAWFEAHGSVDHATRVVTLDRFEVTRADFPDAPDH